MKYRIIIIVIIMFLSGCTSKNNTDSLSDNQDKVVTIGQRNENAEQIFTQESQADEQGAVQDDTENDIIAHVYDQYNGGKPNDEENDEAGTGGDYSASLLSDYLGYWYIVDGGIIELIPKDEFEKWTTLTDVPEINTFYCIKYFGIPKETAKQAFELDLQEGFLTEEQVDFICSGVMDVNRLIELFPSPFAIYVGEKAFPIDWIAAHTWSDYEDVGITEEQIQTFFDARKDAPFKTELERYLVLISGQLEKKRIEKLVHEKGEAAVKIVDYKSKASKWAAFKEKYYGIDDFLNEVVNQEILEKWKGQFVYTSPYYNKYSNILDCSMVNAIKELGIDRQVFDAWNDQKKIYTKKEVDALFSDSQYEINMTFANENALLIDGNIYTKGWLLRYKTEYAVHNITQEQVDLLKSEQSPSQIKLKAELDKNI